MAHRYMQGCTNTGRQVAVATKLSTVAPNVCGSSVRKWLHVILLATTLRWLPPPNCT